MLPSPLLVARVRRGFVNPVYAGMDEANLEAAKTLIDLFQKNIGKRKGGISDEVEQYEEVGFDYRFIRGLATLLERRCIFEAKSSLDSQNVRKLTFQEANKYRVVASQEDRAEILSRVADSLGVSVDEVEESLYGDLEDQLILKEFKPINPEDLLRQYNLSLTQTLLFKSTHLEFTVKGNWQRIFRKIKYLGLMYSAEAKPEGFWVAVDGPLSLFKLTERYGTSLAKLLPEIVEAEGWKIKASIVKGGDSAGGGGRVLQLELRSNEVGYLLKHAPPEPSSEGAFDSSVEERFSKNFQSLGFGWKLAREPEPLTAGTHVFIPDFSLQKDSAKVYLEIVGFWTQEYLERKVQKLQQLSGVDLIIAVDESLACSKLRRVKGKIIYYKRDVPLRPVVDFLREFEERHLTGQIATLKGREIKLEGDVVEIAGIAGRLGVSEEAVKRVLADRNTLGYRLIGDTLISEAKLAKIGLKLSMLQEKTLSKAVQLIEAEGVRNSDLIEALGYTVKWHGLDMEKAVLHKKTDVGHEKANG